MSSYLDRSIQSCCRGRQRLLYQVLEMNSPALQKSEGPASHFEGAGMAFEGVGKYGKGKMGNMYVFFNMSVYV